PGVAPAPGWLGSTPAKAARLQGTPAVGGVLAPPPGERGAENPPSHLAFRSRPLYFLGVPAPTAAFFFAGASSPPVPATTGTPAAPLDTLILAVKIASDRLSRRSVQQGKKAPLATERPL